MVSRLWLVHLLPLAACTSPVHPPGTTDGGEDTATADTGSPFALPETAAVSDGAVATAGVCAECHSNAEDADAMRDAAGRGVAPHDLWSATVMANSARDPLWRAQVSLETLSRPAAREHIETTCIGCHAPEAAVAARLAGEDAPTMAVLFGEDDRGSFARDGVGCVTCHGMAAEGLGEEASFSAGFGYAGDGVLFGPHADPVTSPMEEGTGFSPAEGAHVGESAACGTCHVVRTDTLDYLGQPTGDFVLEQATYLEWAASEFAARGVSCQSCHLPTSDTDGTPISTALARQPDGTDFPELSPRAPYGRHAVVGGNTVVPRMLAAHPETSPVATPEAFEAIVEATRETLADAASIRIEGYTEGESLTFDVRVEVAAGHRFPSGVPLRRAWLHTRVLDAGGALVFESGAVDARGQLVDSDGAALPSEDLGGFPEPHRDRVASAEDVVVWEAILADPEGFPTWLFLQGAGFFKDDRLLPAGWDTDAAEAWGIEPVGVRGDDDFGPGGDVVHFDLPLAAGPYTVEVELLYQSLAPRALAEMLVGRSAEITGFDTWYTEDLRVPERVAVTSAP